MTNEPGISPASSRHEPGANPAEDRQNGTSPAEGRQLLGISLQEATIQLDVSERTVRRMLQEGELNGYKQKATRGYVWRVVLDSPPLPEHGTVARQDGIQTGTSPAHVEEPTGIPATVPELMKTLEMLDEERRMLAEERQKVDRLQAELREASNATAHWQARALTAEQTVQRLLPAPKEEPEPTAVTPQEAPTPADTGPDWQGIALALEERVKRLEEPPAEPEAEHRPWWRRLFG